MSSHIFPQTPFSKLQWMNLMIYNVSHLSDSGMDLDLPLRGGRWRFGGSFPSSETFENKDANSSPGAV